MNEIAKRDEQELTPALIKKYICPVATDQEIYMFFQLCKVQNLNPFLREAYLIKYGTEKATIVVGKETFTKRADSLPMNDGFSAGIIVIANDKQVTYREGALIVAGETLLGGWATAYRKDRSHPIRAEVSMSEYVRYNKEGKPTKAWLEMPATMIRKVALVQALREAYPSEFGGMYTPEEMPIDTSNMPDYKMGQDITPPAIPMPQRRSETTQAATSDDNPFESDETTAEGLTVKEVKVKTGTKGNKPWTKYEVLTSDGVIYSTFSSTLGGRAQEAEQSGAVVEVTGNESQYGHDLTGLTIVSIPAQTEGSGWNIEKIVSIISSSDSVDILDANWKSLLPHIGKLSTEGKAECQKAHDALKECMAGSLYE